MVWHPLLTFTDAGGTPAVIVTATLADVSGHGEPDRKKRKPRGEAPPHFKVTGEALRQLVMLHLGDAIAQVEAVTEAQAPDTREALAENVSRETIDTTDNYQPPQLYDISAIANAIQQIEHRLMLADMAALERAIMFAIEEEEIATLLLSH